MTNLYLRSCILVAMLSAFAQFAYSQNTAYGTGALASDTSGIENTAFGSYALHLNTTANYNTALGTAALYSNTTGYDNTASGFEALAVNTTGSENTALGSAALAVNTTGSENTALGSVALGVNTTGSENTALGSAALAENSTGDNNTAVGVGALWANTTGEKNTASGYQALFFNTTGSKNIAVGFQAGINLTTGSENIDIGNEGAAGDNKMIKIGTEGTQKKAFIAGIFNNTAVSGLQVVINSSGELGVVSSSERFKTAIAPMGSNTEKLHQLRPVTFHYKADAQGMARYGLIAEEVAKVYPELVVRDEKGRIDGVRYDELAPMLLNELQKEHATIAAQAAEIRDLKQRQKQFATRPELNDLKQQLQAALAALRPKDQLVAQR